MSTQLVALTPSDLVPAQHQLATWCHEKILALSRELREQRENLRIAKRAKWRHTGWLNAITRTKARMIHYVKVKQAVEAGYLIVPNFDLDVLAVRVKRETPPPQTSCSSADAGTAKPQLLPPGQGRYVDSVLFTQNLSHDEPVEGQPGKTRYVAEYRASRYDEIINFPILAIKPLVLAATERAMALQLFDRIGIVRNQRSDPIIVGELLEPSDRFHQRRVSFFIAWWLDMENL